MSDKTRWSVAAFSILVLALGGAVWAGNGGGTPNGLRITEVFVDLEYQALFISGNNLDNGGAATVTMGDFIEPLVVLSHSADEIVARLPHVYESDPIEYLYGPGDYVVTVSTGNGSNRTASFDVTISATKPAVNPPVVSTLLSHSEVEECISDDDEMNCSTKDIIALDVGDTNLIIETVASDNPGIEESIKIEIERNGFDVNVTVTVGGYENKFTVSPSEPIYASYEDNDYDSDYRVKASLSHGHLLRLVVDPARVKSIIAESLAIITDAHVIPDPVPGLDPQLLVTIQNKGDLKANYFIEIHDCGVGFLSPVAQSCVVQPGLECTTRFVVHRMDDFSPGTTFCYVSLKSPNGRIYDEQRVMFDWPAPSP